MRIIALPSPGDDSRSERRTKHRQLNTLESLLLFEPRTMKGSVMGPSQKYVTPESWQYKFPFSSSSDARDTQSKAMSRLSRQWVLEKPGILLMHTPREGRSRSHSPTVSVFRARWDTLTEWVSFINDFQAYWQSLPPPELTAIVDVRNQVAGIPDNIEEDMQDGLPTREAELYDPFRQIYAVPHNIAARPIGATHPHARIKESNHDKIAGEPDFMFVFQGYSVGIIEIKTFWHITPQSIDEVLFGRAPLEGTHAGRLAVEQTYGYMVRNAKRIGVLSTVNGFVFMIRENFGKLRMTRLIPCDVINPFSPTILQMLYFLSGFAALLPPLPETTINGNPVRLSWGHPRKPEAAPRVPSQYSASPPSTTQVAPIGSAEIIYFLRDDPDSRTVIFEPWKTENQLGHKTFLLQLDSHKEKVVGKLWDGYKHNTEERDNEVEAYMQLQNLWGKTVPKFMGCGEIDFFWALLTGHVQGTELSEDNLNATIIQNILQAFRSIHALGVIHSDVRKENILVREDNSVVIVDFEMSSFMDVTADQMALEEKIVEELLDDLQGPGCQCTARTSKVTAEIGV